MGVENRFIKKVKLHIIQSNNILSKTEHTKYSKNLFGIILHIYIYIFIYIYIVFILNHVTN